MTEAAAPPITLTVCVIVFAAAANARLTLTLQALHAQQLPNGVDLSIVVTARHDVEDVTGQKNSELGIPKVCWSEVDGLSAVAARRQALSAVKADLVLWLDAGICLPEHWLNGALALMDHDRSVVLGETLGSGEDVSSVVESMPSTPSGVAKLIEAVRALPAWQDPHAAEFDLASPYLPDDVLPWTLVGARPLLVRTAFCRDVIGVDESSLGWAEASLELSLNLSRAGARFSVYRQPCAIRLKVAGEVGVDELDSVSANANWLFDKYPCLETEAFLAVGHFSATIMHRLERLPMEYVVPRYRAEVIDALRESLKGATNALLLGGTEHLARELVTVTHLLAPSSQHHQRLSAAFPGRAVVPALGVRLPSEAGAFDVAIVTDFFGGLCNALKVPIVRELRRVAKRIVFICSPDIMTQARASFGWAKTDPQMLRFVLTSLDVKTAVRACQIGPHLLVEVPS